MAATDIHIVLSAEPIFTVGNLVITNSMFTSVIVSAILVAFALVVRSKLTNTSTPSGLQNFAEWVVESLYNFVHSITGDHKKTKTFLPVVSTFFLFILLNNWFGLLPGVGTITVPEPELKKHAEVETHSFTFPLEVQAATTELETDAADDHSEEGSTYGGGTVGETHAGDDNHGPVAVPIFRPGSADLNTTLALAIISVSLTQFYGLKFAKLGYLSKFFNFSSPIMFFVGILEIISEVAKIISFAFRLFGNIFAGEVLLVVLMFLTKVVAPMPFYGLELFVGFIQALVFSMLSLVFFNMATESHAH